MLSSLIWRALISNPSYTKSWTRFCARFLTTREVSFLALIFRMISWCSSLANLRNSLRLSEPILLTCKCLGVELQIWVSLSQVWKKSVSTLLRIRNFARLRHAPTGIRDHSDNLSNIMPLLIHMCLSCSSKSWYHKESTLKSKINSPTKTKSSRDKTKNSLKNNKSKMLMSTKLLYANGSPNVSVIS